MRAFILMSALSTLEAYQSIAAGLALPKSAYIDSRFRNAANGETFDTINPANGTVLAGITACGQNVTTDMTIARDEIFGLVLAVITVAFAHIMNLFLL